MKQQNWQVHGSIWIFLTYMMQIVVTDNIMYWAKMPYIPAFLISLVLHIGVQFFIHRKGLILIRFQASRWDAVFYVLLLIVMLLDIGFADESYDTMMYHIYLQENPFGVDKICGDFLAGRTVTTFVFGVADRCFYPFRILLGYRLGTLPSYLILIPLYYECKFLLSYLIPFLSEKQQVIGAMVPICSFVILYQLGSYLIDNFSIVLLLEFSIIILVHGREAMYDRRMLGYLSLLAGLAIGVKYINAIYMIGVICYIAIRGHRGFRQLRWYDYLLYMVFLTLPMLPYLVDAWIQTGSPVYPYYNTIFHSPLFAEYDWLDTRFGPKTILEFLVWPIWIIVKPTRTNDFQHLLTDFAFAAGYLIAWIKIVCTLVDRIRRKDTLEDDSRQRNTFVLALLFLYDCFAWEKFALGYARYGGIVLVLGTILVLVFYFEGLRDRCWVKKSLAGISVVISVMIGIVFFCVFGGPRSYANIFVPKIANLLKEDRPEQKIKQSFTCLWKDRKQVTYDIDGVWGVICDDSLAPTLLNVDDPIVQLEYGYKTGETEYNRQIFMDHVSGQDIYVPLYGDLADRKRAALEQNGYEICGTVVVLEDVGFIQGDQTVEIIVVRKR